MKDYFFMPDGQCHVIPNYMLIPEDLFIPDAYLYDGRTDFWYVCLKKKSWLIQENENVPAELKAKLLLLI